MATPWDNLEQAALQAYEAYCVSLGGKLHGKVLPIWTSLPASQQRAWCHATARTLGKAYRILADHLVKQISEDVEQNVRDIDEALRGN
jgi:hypothetical protein